MEQGFERAPTIVAGELRTEWGGGVCQVSSTLYNAALLAGLSVTERHAHSRRVSSVPPGRDATAAFGIADLKFVNTTGNAIRIRASATRTRLAIVISGKSRQNSNIQIVTAPQSHGHSNFGGETVLTYKLTPNTDGSFRRDLISNDVYSTPAYADNNEVKR
jgi:vancomycin resistance protein YoaR